MGNKKNDQFADIAMKKMGSNHPELIYPEPIAREDICLPLDSGDDARRDFQPLKKLSTKAELREELERWKERYRPFLQNLAPPLRGSRKRIDISRFDWRIEEEEDQRDFNRILSGQGNWESVTIPHYGGPLGKAVTYYRTSFMQGDLPGKSQSAFICFQGADYKAHVFLNGAYVGSHEGFFAPFEFDITNCLRAGDNILVVKLENDFIFGGNVNAGSQGIRYEGDKLYAATGPGYDDPETGWHHCPPGMGLYQDVYLETRNSVFCHDLFVRPNLEEKAAEAWLEISSTSYEPQDVTVRLSLYGQNFRETVFEDMKYTPSTGREIGLGDSFTEQKLRSEGLLEKPVLLKVEKGINLLKIPFSIPNARIWEPGSPWLYQIQVEVHFSDETLPDTESCQFGMRSFRLDTDCTPKGMFYLNNRKIRLRGANTMGHEQQCVMQKDWNQLIEDILLARICNMNFLRLTQRPVQKDVYEYCDRLGLMTQTDLPLFGVLKRDRFSEAVRQAEEMERLVRSHPCNILISYINEPFPNSGNKPHRHLSRPELHGFFKTADIVVKLNNPDRVIKHVDGDYDPPSETLPDNHCYTFWYNGHGLEAGKLHKGYWMPVRKDWNYGCGEFGVEGLESTDIMRKYYPAQWLPQSPEEEQTWSPSQIVGSQTGNFHHMFFPTPDTLEGWVRSSQAWQAEGLKMMTEAFRRDPRMVSFAVHLFIDAFPSGWMKTIMDCERNPKPAYFAYRDALEPLLISLRSDRFRFTSGENVKVEIWICNDLDTVLEDATLCYRVELNNETLFSGEGEAKIPPCSTRFQGYMEFSAPEVTEAETVTLRAAIKDSKGNVICDSREDFKIFPKMNRAIKTNVYAPAGNNERGIIQFFKLKPTDNLPEADLIIIDSLEEFRAEEEEILNVVRSGAVLLFLSLSPGDFNLGDKRIILKECGMMPVHFVSLAKGTALPAGVDNRDFRFWYDPDVDRISPLLKNTFTAEGFSPLLISGNMNEKGEWGPALAVADMSFGSGKIVICQVSLENRLADNPPAAILAERLIRKEK